MGEVIKILRPRVNAHDAAPSSDLVPLATQTLGRAVDAFRAADIATLPYRELLAIWNATATTMNAFATPDEGAGPCADVRAANALGLDYVACETINDAVGAEMVARDTGMDARNVAQIHKYREAR